MNKPSVETKNLDLGALNNLEAEDHLKSEENEVIVGQKSKILSYMS